MPFNVDATYAAGEGTPHGRYVKISIAFRQLLPVHNTSIYCKLDLGNGVVDRGCYA
jgi:hypothetical protein